jgi:hypothetical protein
MNDDSILHATPLSEKGKPVPVDMGPQKVGDLDLLQSRAVRERQQGRARMMGLILGGLCILFFAITIVKIGVWG